MSYLAPSPKCKNETLKKVRPGFGLRASSLDLDILDQDIKMEDCKALCLRNKACTTIRHCLDHDRCSTYKDAPSNDPSIVPLPATCSLYVKSCGNVFT